jgi:hypothetical protein
MPKNLIWLIIALVLIGLFISTATHSPQTNNPADQKAASQAKPEIKTVPNPAANNGTIAVDTQWLIEPGVRVDKITAKTTLADLQAAYGKDNIKSGQVPGPEGTTLPGAIVFPHDPERTLTIIWKERKPTQTPESISISGKKTLWHTADGITLGTPLKELERLNGGAFTLSGFDWDYGGTVLSWGDHGKLKEKYQKAGTLVLRLAPPENAPAQLTNQVLGDKTFSSSIPAMQAINPTVSSMMVMF